MGMTRRARAIRSRPAAGVATAVAGLGLSYVYGAVRLRWRTAARFRIDDPPAPGSPEFARLVESLTGATLRQGNRLSVLRNGRQTFPAMLDAIADARRTIDFSSYIYWPGDITEQFTKAFAEQSRAGVEVRVVLDGWGSAKLDRDHVARLREAGVKVAFYRPPRWYTLDKLNMRMHRRLMVVDGCVGFAGGVGIADVWQGDAEDPDHWRETHVRVEGAAVRDIEAGFMENWTECTGEILARAHVPDLPSLDDGGMALQVTRSSPRASGTAAAQLFYAATVGARRRLWLTTAYFAAGPHLRDALAAAARRGVDVRILLNGPNIDKNVVRRTAQHAYAGLLDAGVRVFEYQRTMLHAKVLIVDDWANVGSSNFDYRSFALDMELNVSLTESAVVAELERHFLDDLDGSEEVDPTVWERRSLPARAGECVADLIRQSF